MTSNAKSNLKKQKKKITMVKNSEYTLDDASNKSKEFKKYFAKLMNYHTKYVSRSIFLNKQTIH